MSTEADFRVTLENCDREPIHIPGRIQQHGALFAFDAAGVLTHRSANADELLGPRIPALGEPLAAAHFGGDAAVHEALREWMAHESTADAIPAAREVTLDGRRFELVVHRAGGAVVAEFELRPPAEEDLSDFAFKAHRSMERLRRQGTTDALLSVAVQELRALTGFDRVMAYRFRHDDSGDIVAEARDETLEPFLNRRYPASDIPAQARRLYLINTLRLIADVESGQVEVQAAQAGAPPLDMSHCVLRSVSPIHLEYLHNLGVAASMSVSIVINGRLWGMLACHHRQPHQVKYSIRMACDVLAQLLAANLQSLAAREHAARVGDAATLRSRVVEGMLHADESVPVLAGFAQELAASFGAQGVAVAQEGKLAVHGDVPQALLRELVAWLSQQPARSEPLAMNDLCSAPGPLREALGSWCGVLALPFDPAANGWLLLLRKEQVETIAWGGRPEKEYVAGPHGPRLTPRGSFDVWREEVRGKAVPWDETEMEIARDLLAELVRAVAVRLAELSRARTQLLAMLGHDLRDPLAAINLAAGSLGETGDGSQIGRRIQSSSSRMQRLVGQVMDMSRLQSGIGLGLRFSTADLVRLVDDLIAEVQTAHPGTGVVRQMPRRLEAEVDADRVAQVVSNLLSNARHHGAPGESMMVQLEERDGQVNLDVSNVGQPIAAELLPNLFNPFKRAGARNPRNPASLGLGLYIAQQIVAGHGGTLEYSYAEPYVVFSASFPAKRNPPGA